MVNWQVWEEEIRSFPFGGSAAAVWVVRKEGLGDSAPLSLLFYFGWGEGQRSDEHGNPLGRYRLPLNRLQSAIRTGDSLRGPWPQRKAAGTVLAAARSNHRGSGYDRSEAGGKKAAGHQLWVKPLLSPPETQGALAVMYDDSPPWNEAVRLWGARFAARLTPLLSDLPVWPSRAGLGQFDDGFGAGQPMLFPDDVIEAMQRCESDHREIRTGLPLPRPVFVPDVPGAVGISREMRTCCGAIEALARSDVNVLLHGESGTGKEIIARAIHHKSLRSKGPFCGQNCAALPETLFESELFGHKSGAFTGASSDKIGLLEAASGGTFFLDEIGDMPVPLQIKLLRVMQERQVRRIGELEGRTVDIRFIAATHKDLEKEISAGQFRLDLYYRLKVVRLVIPPLRQRPEDISHLVAYFISRHGGREGRKRITERALAALQAYRWPGNVRELENEVCRLLAIFPDEPVIDLKHLSAEIQSSAGWSVDPADLSTLRPLDEANQLLERYLIRKAIAASGGRKAAAARRLGLSRQGLYKKIQRYGMTDLINGVGRSDSSYQTA